MFLLRNMVQRSPTFVDDADPQATDTNDYGIDKYDTSRNSIQTMRSNDIAGYMITALPKRRPIQTCFVKIFENVDFSDCGNFFRILGILFGLLKLLRDIKTIGGM